MTRKPMTRQQILDLKVGDLVRVTYDVQNGKATKEARYSDPRAILRFCSKGILNAVRVGGDTVGGRAYACFFRDIGDGKEIDCRITEGDTNVVLEAP